MLLAGCSTVCTTVAEAAKMWNLVVVSVLVHRVIFPRKARGESEFFFFFSFCRELYSARAYRMEMNARNAAKTRFLSFVTVRRRQHCPTEIDSRPSSGRILPPPYTIPRESNCCKSSAGLG